MVDHLSDVGGAHRGGGEKNIQPSFFLEYYHVELLLWLLLFTRI